jgi:hypothetical protein
MSSLLSLVESRLSAEIDGITSLVMEQRLQYRAVAVRPSAFLINLFSFELPHRMMFSRNGLRLTRLSQ